MKKIAGVFLGLGILCAMAVVAISADNKDAGKSKEAPVAQTQAPSQEDQAKQQVMNDLGLMQNQEVRVIVLQQVLNREVNELRQAQAVFCDAYKLDVEKWRKGLYRYDDKKAKFVEVPEEPKTK